MQISSSIDRHRPNYSCCYSTWLAHKIINLSHFLWLSLSFFTDLPPQPLPVPSLPEPPIGRFPPEMPSLPVNTQVPFRYNNNQQRQEQYNNAYQRMHQQPQMPAQPQLQQQSNLNGGKAQFSAHSPQNQPAYSASSVSFPGQQSSGQHQPDVAQRKSSLDYEPVVSSRSFFGGNSGKPASSASTLNNRIGTMGNQPLDYLSDNILNSYASHHGSLGTSSESKGATGATQGDVLSNSHVINKFKSYFSRASPSSPTSSSSSSSGQPSSKPVNPYEQYQKMSLIQALIKDTSFLPAFMTGNANKVSAPSSSASSSSAVSNNKVKNQGGNTLSERMISTTSSHNGGAQFNYNTDSLQSPSKQHSSSGIMKAADKIAHALLESLTTGLQRHSTSPSQSGPSSSSSSVTSSKSSNGDQMNSRKSPISDSDLSPMDTNPSPSTASDRSSTNNQSKTSSADSSSAASASPSSPSYQSDNVSADHSSQSVANSRSDDSSDLVAVKQTSESKSPNQSSSSSSSSLSRKTRSIDQHISEPQPQKPSTAANINHVIDYVSDSYAQNRLLFSTILHQVGLGHATHYMDSILIGNTNVH